MVDPMQMLRIDDIIISVAYFSIPIQLVVSLVRYPRLASMPLHILVLMILFALFIFLCGAGHLMRCLNYTSLPIFFIINWFTAFISLLTAAYLVPLVPNLMCTLDAGLQELRRLNIECEESRRKLVTFMAFLCHEIRNPLFAVTSFCDFLEDEELSPTQDRALSSIQQSTQLMLRLVGDVLDINKLESGRLELEEEEFQLRDLLQNASTSMEIQLVHKVDVDYKFHLAANVPRVVYGDSARILQITYNLLSNAGKFTEKGMVEFNASMISYDDALKKGWIINNVDEVSNKLVYDGDVPASSIAQMANVIGDDDIALRLLSAEEGLIESPPKCVLKIEVIDTGKGIANDVLERIFVPYSWSKLTEYRAQGGTGLGLAILSKLSRKMGGTIHVTSTEGVGSTFTVYLQLHVLPDGLPSAEYCQETKRVASTECRELLQTHGPVCLGFKKLADNKTISHSLLLVDNSIRPLQPASCLSPLSSQTLPTSAELSQPKVESPVGHRRKPSFDIFAFDSLNTKEEKVLIVDDNLVNRKLLSRMMSQFKLEFELAENGQEAVDLMLKSRNYTGKPTATSYSLIIMDISMPVLDGHAATRMLRERGLDIPIVALTACAVEGSKQDAIDAGATEFLTKPIKREHLHKICTHYLLGDGSSSDRRVIIV